MRIIGKQLVVALASAVKPLRSRGGYRETMPGFACEPGDGRGYPAFCSCRTRSRAAVRLHAAREIGDRDAGGPKIVSMPFNFSASITS